MQTNIFLIKWHKVPFWLNATPQLPFYNLKELPIYKDGKLELPFYKDGHQVSARSLPGVNLFSTDVRDLVLFCHGYWYVWFYWSWPCLHGGDQGYYLVWWVIHWPACSIQWALHGDRARPPGGQREPLWLSERWRGWFCLSSPSWRFLVVLSCSPTWSLSTAPWVVRWSGWYGSRSFVCWWNSICFSWSQWTFLLSFECQSPWWDPSIGFDSSGKCQNYPYVRRSKLNSCGEVMASLHKAPYRYTQSQHPFHQLGRIAARRGGSRWGIGFLFPLRWYLQGNSNFYVITKADVDSFS